MCVLLGGHLAAINSKAEDDYVNKLIIASEIPDFYHSIFYIGAFWSNGGMQWTDGTPYIYDHYVPESNHHTFNENSVMAIFTYVGRPSEEGEWQVQDTTNMFDDAAFICQLPVCTGQRTITMNTTLAAKHLVANGDYYYAGDVLDDFNITMFIPECAKFTGTFAMPRNSYDNTAVWKAGMQPLSHDRVRMDMDTGLWWAESANFQDQYICQIHVNNTIC